MDKKYCGYLLKTGYILLIKCIMAFKTIEKSRRNYESQTKCRMRRESCPTCLPQREKQSFLPLEFYRGISLL